MNEITVFGIASIFLIIINIIMIVLKMRKIGFNFKNSFICDFYEFKRASIAELLVYIVSLGAIIATYISGLIVYHNILCYLACGLFSLAFLLNIFIVLFRAKQTNTVMVMHYIFFFLFTISTLCVGVSGFFEKRYINAPAFPMWLWICFIVIGSVLLLGFANPLLWKPKFVEKAEDNGLTIKIRKKVIWISIYYWIYMLCMAVEIVLLIVSSFFMEEPEPLLLTLAF